MVYRSRIQSPAPAPGACRGKDGGLDSEDAEAPCHWRDASVGGEGDRGGYVDNDMTLDTTICKSWVSSNNPPSCVTQ